MSIVNISLATLGEFSSQDLATAAMQEVLRCRQLEEGNLLFFPQAPIVIAENDLQFLLTLEQNLSTLHKNITYKVAQNHLSGASLRSADATHGERLRRMLRDYSQSVTQFLTAFLAPYQNHLQVDYASFRPLEERGRDLPLHKRNDLLHIDAFPTRPTQGARILRFFHNIHPTQPREWMIGEPFRTLVPQFAPRHIAWPRAENAWIRSARGAVRGIGVGRILPVLQRSPYDRFMLRFHHHLKESDRYQAEGEREAISFPPGSSWMVYSDAVPHAVVAGQYALEQTFLVAPQAMVAPEHAPLRVLESLAGQRLL